MRRHSRANGGRIVQVMIDLRHPDQIGAAVSERYFLSGSLPVADFSGHRLAPRFVDHLLRRVDADDLDAEMRRQ
jgi:hypothetical protein